MDLNKTASKLVFEGVGVECANGTKSVRIRTRLRDRNGRVVYLELSGVERHKYLIRAMSETPFDCIGFITSAYYDHDESKPLPNPDNQYFDYTNDGILKFVNEFLGTSYEDLEISFRPNVNVFQSQDCLC
ncbi:MAG: hypothetical protein MHMPM18_003717 [Marteilia pararefringens]